MLDDIVTMFGVLWPMEDIDGGIFRHVYHICYWCIIFLLPWYMDPTAHYFVSVMLGFITQDIEVGKLGG